MSENEVKSISMSSTSFETFLRCVSLMQDICTDIDIHQGFIRQRSNDLQTIFEIDLTTIIDDFTFPILQVKDKLSLLKLFRGNDVQLNLVENEYFELSDDFSKFVFRIPDAEYKDNVFMSDNELSSLFELFNDDIIMSTNINFTVSNRIKVVKDVYNINNIFVELNGDNASIYAKTESGDQSATFLSEIITEKEMNALSPQTLIPFTIDHDGDIELNMYNYESDKSINKFSTSIESVDIVLYSRSQLLDLDESDEEDPF